ncbi:hypothetical protein QAD02_008026 [Eretmocerus hayati]|uniref:Uncharacterized protein n=1 Tax=Eretmocerus hayati TaxID=131215 RepID=A0ACC2N7S1_9HYME|nr:hypothetical protein QAD02_008026 [Eretmocerus hayati]
MEKIHPENPALQSNGNASHCNANALQSNESASQHKEGSTQSNAHALETNGIETQSGEIQKIVPSSLKRPPPSSTASISSQENVTAELEQEETLNKNTALVDKDGFQVPKRKRNSSSKRKRDDNDRPKVDSSNYLLKLKEALGDWKFSLEFSEFQKFMEEAQNSKDIESLVEKFSSNADDLVSIIDELYSCTVNAALKAQFTRTKKKLLHQPTTDTENDADGSSKSDAEMIQ